MATSTSLLEGGNVLVKTQAGPMTPLDILVAILSGVPVEKLRP